MGTNSAVEQNVNTSGNIKIGDVVRFKSGSVYVSSTAAKNTRSTLSARTAKAFTGGLIPRMLRNESATMEILKFLLANWDSVLLVAVIAVSLILLYKHGRVGIVKKILFSLILRAKKKFGSGTGELKKAAD